MSRATYATDRVQTHFCKFPRSAVSLQRVWIGRHNNSNKRRHRLQWNRFVHILMPLYANLQAIFFPSLARNLGNNIV